MTLTKSPSFAIEKCMKSYFTLFIYNKLSKYS